MMIASAYIVDATIVIRLLNYSIHNYYIWAGVNISSYLAIILMIRKILHNESNELRELKF